MRSATDLTWASASATGWSARSTGGARPQVPRAAAGLPLPQLDVAAAVERAAQRLDERQRVGWIVGGAQRQQELTDLGGGVDHRGVLGAIRQRRATKFGFERRQRDPGGQAGCRCHRVGTGATHRWSRRTPANRRRVRSTPLRRRRLLRAGGARRLSRSRRCVDSRRGRRGDRRPATTRCRGRAVVSAGTRRGAGTPAVRRPRT